MLETIAECITCIVPGLANYQNVRNVPSQMKIIYTLFIFNLKRKYPSQILSYICADTGARKSQRKYISLSLDHDLLTYCHQLSSVCSDGCRGGWMVLKVSWVFCFGPMLWFWPSWSQTIWMYVIHSDKSWLGQQQIILEITRQYICKSLTFREWFLAICVQVLFSFFWHFFWQGCSPIQTRSSPAQTCSSSISLNWSQLSALRLINLV